MVLPVRDVEPATAVSGEATREIQTLGAGRSRLSGAIIILGTVREGAKLAVDGIGGGITRLKIEYPVIARMTDIQPAWIGQNAEGKDPDVLGGGEPGAAEPIIVRWVGGEAAELAIDHVGRGVIEHPMILAIGDVEAAIGGQ